jgi:tRNA pseudouridine32 synthase/23S rRNA pseudouridine746 synthase
MLHALYLQHLLTTRKAIDFDSESAYSTDRLFESGGGLMFGVLTACDQAGNEVLLKAFSGSLGGRRNLPHWAPHVVNDQDYDVYMKQYDQNIKKHAGRAQHAPLPRKPFPTTTASTTWRPSTVPGFLSPHVFLLPTSLPAAGIVVR